MAQLLDITEGWTGELGPFTLLLDGAAQNLTGMTVVAKIRPEASSSYVDLDGDVRVDSDATTGKVYLNFDADDLEAASSPYTLHFQVTDGNGKVVFFPNGKADTIRVHRL
jgi:hypothetical protein